MKLIKVSANHPHSFNACISNCYEKFRILSASMKRQPIAKPIWYVKSSKATCPGYG